MFKEATLTYAAQLAEVLDTGDVYLGGHEASLLGHAMTGVGPLNLEAETDISAVRAAVKGEVEYDKHSQVIAEATHHVLRAATASISLVKTVINPLVQEIVTASAQAAASVDTNHVANIKISPIKLPSIYESEQLSNALMPYRTPTAFVPSRGLSNELMSELRQLSGEELTGALTTNDAAFNAMLAEINVDKDNRIRDGYVFWDYRNINTYTNVSIVRNHTLLTSFLLMRALLNGRIESVEVSSVDKAVISDILRLYGESLVRAYGRFSDFVKSGSMVIDEDTDTRTVYVLMRNYTKYLEADGSVEAVMGAYLNNDLVGKSYETIVGNKEYYEGIYTNRVRHIETENRVIANGDVVSLVRKHIFNEINESDSYSEDTKSLLRDRIIELAETYPFRGMEHIDSYVRYMVCQTIGFNTDALSILDTMDEFMKAHPEASIEEAQVEAITKRLARFWVSQMEVFDATNGTPYVTGKKIS